MDTIGIDSIDRKTALEVWRAYQTHVHYSTPIDQEVMKAYQLLAKGRLVIQALASIIKAGVDAEGFPKLAIVRADLSRCYLQLHGTGSARMAGKDWVHNHETRFYVDFPPGSFPINAKGHSWRAQSIVPPVPLLQRPKRGLQNYHTLFEAEWHQRVPVDPFLLRRIGQSDLWAVVAMWEVSQIEAAVLASRVAVKR